jgi:C4-dicarboxylate transporter DctM subunit
VRRAPSCSPSGGAAGRPAGLREVLVESAATTGMIFTILIGALVFANFVNLTTMPGELIAFSERLCNNAAGSHRRRSASSTSCSGCVLESMSMILLTVPMFYPVVQHLGFDLIWFGIIVVVVTEISLITPPVGLNVFVLRSVLPDIPDRARCFAASCPSSPPMSSGWRCWSLFPAITLVLTQFVR